jgi:beta-glucanase (GH16 family)
MTLGNIMNTATLTSTFDDEINSFSSSPTGATGTWQTTVGNNNRTLGSNGEEEYYSDSSVGVNPFSIQNGVLDITASPGSNPLGLPYNSGAINTQHSFSQLYGYFEIDAELPTGQGLWPAFWMLPESGAWPPELDAFEVLGNDPTTLYFSTHSSVQATQGTTLNVANVSSGFNLYGVMWGPQTVDLYINNVEVASMPTPADMNVPMYMLANLAVGGYWPGDPNSTTPFPATMQINYIRAYAYPGTSGGSVNDTPPAQSTAPTATAPGVSTPVNVRATSGAATQVGGISITADDPNDNFTVKVSDNAGLLQTSATTDVVTSGQGTTSITLTGDLASINSALATLTYQGNKTGSEDIWISATDPQGLQGLGSVVTTVIAKTAPVVTTTPSETTPTAPAPVVTTPVVTTPGSFKLATNTTGTLGGISVADSNTTGNLTVLVCDSSGLLNTDATSGVTEQGEDSAALKLTGSLAAINADLATLSYTANGATGNDWLWVSAANTGGPQDIGGPVVVTVTPAAKSASPQPSSDAPVVTAPKTFSLSAGSTGALQGVSVADSHTAGDLTVVISDATGLLNTAPASGVTQQGEGSTALRLTGSAAAIDTDLASLTYKANAAGTDWLWVSANATTGLQGVSPVVVTAAAPSPNTVSLTGVMLGVTDTAQFVTATLTDTKGLLATTSQQNVTTTGENSTHLTLSGIASTVSAELASLTYTGSTTDPVAGSTDTLHLTVVGAAGNQLSSMVLPLLGGHLAT